MSAHGALLIAVLVLVLLLIIWTVRAPDSGIDYVPYYFDNNGTTPPCKEALAAWHAAARLGNASSAYATPAKHLICRAKRTMQNWLGAPWEVLFTSGGSESNNLMLRGFPCKSLLLGSTEHITSLDCAKALAQDGLPVILLPTELDGHTAPLVLDHYLQDAPAPALVSIMHANNETGALNDLPALLRVCEQRGAIFHTDAVQTFGKYGGLARHCHALSASFHKLGGPLGVGLLALRPDLAAQLRPQICGAQQGGLRGGTDNTPGIAAAEAALCVAAVDREAKNARMRDLRDSIVAGLQARFPFVPFTAYQRLNDPDADRLVLTMPGPFHIVPLSPFPFSPLSSGESGEKGTPNTFLFSVVKTRPPHFCNLRLRDRLLAHGIAVSIGSACHTGKPGPSHVLRALQAPFLVRCGVVRISLGDRTSASDVCFLLGVLPRLIYEQLS